MRERTLLFLIRTIAWRVMLWWCHTLTIKKNNSQQFNELRHSGKNFVAIFWHGSMLLGWFLHRPLRSETVSALVSQSKDGEYLSSIIQRWGFTTIRGSSHIGGKEAMQLMTDAVVQGSSMCVTPDGPRGPRHEMKMGAIRLAQKTNVPLVLVGIAMKRKKIFHSWDQFELPLPFTNVSVWYSEPINVPALLTGEAMDEFKIHLQHRLEELTAKAEECL